VVGGADRRRREGLRRSLEHPHAEAAELADAGLDGWAASLPEDEGLADIAAGKPVRWVEGEGWIEEPQLLAPGPDAAPPGNLTSSGAPERVCLWLQAEHLGDLGPEDLDELAKHREVALALHHDACGPRHSERPPGVR
jgi:hypothetical protein